MFDRLGGYIERRARYWIPRNGAYSFGYLIKLMGVHCEEIQLLRKSYWQKQQILRMLQKTTVITFIYNIIHK